MQIVVNDHNDKMANSPIRILIINPNTSKNMTDALIPAVEGLGYSNVEYSYFTCPTPGIPSINSPDDAAKSAEACLPHLISEIPNHDAFLVACYSHHPLVHLLKSEIQKSSLSKTGGQSTTTSRRKHVTGIFEASVVTSLSIVGSSEGEGFGIVSTGKVWEKALLSAVHDFTGAQKGTDRFLGCETTGLNASELHELPPETVRVKMMEATKRLLENGKKAGVDVRAICLGCAGMVGLEEAVRRACVEGLGEEEGGLVSIVDGVKAGVGVLIGLARCGV